VGRLWLQFNYTDKTRNNDVMQRPRCNVYVGGPMNRERNEACRKNNLVEFAELQFASDCDDDDDDDDGTLDGHS